MTVPPSLSVMVMTSPGREPLLARCLERLAAQSDRDFELLVVDDGSEGGAELLTAYESIFPEVVYLWRDNDRCVSISRNLGAATAQGDWLVCLDSDLLLNSGAIASYRAYAGQLTPAQLLYGYYGHGMQARSQWFPTPVNWVDSRFLTRSVVGHAHFRGGETLDSLYTQFHPGLWVPNSLFSEPELYAAGANFMMHRSVCRETGGFDESLARWEDLSFGLSLSRKGCEIHFTPDTWAEHQCHPQGHDWAEVHQAAYRRFFEAYAQLPDIRYQVRVLCQDEPLAELDRSCSGYAAQAEGDFGVIPHHQPPGSPGTV